MFNQITITILELNVKICNHIFFSTITTVQLFKISKLYYNNLILCDSNKTYKTAIFFRIFEVTEILFSCKRMHNYSKRLT